METRDLYISKSPGQHSLPRREFTLPFDPLLLIAVIGIGISSIFVIQAATQGDIPGRPNYYANRQSVYLIVGLLLAALVSRLDYRVLIRYRFHAYGVLIGSLVAVKLFGSVAGGSRRAITLPFFSFQASELGKVLMVVLLAAILVEQKRRSNSLLTMLLVIGLTLIPAGIVLFQPDLGSSLVYLAIAGGILFVSGIQWRYLAALSLAVVVSIIGVLVVAPAVGVQVLHDYQRQRLTAFLHPTQNPGKEGYQQSQARIAIGAGGRSGRGTQATQTALNFVPEHHTDFAFAVVGERWGFIGASLIVSLYALLIWRVLRILACAPDLFGALLAAGVFSMLLFQIFINIGMNIGIMPITGIPLPMLSYGGSSVITTFLALGVLQSVGVRSFKRA